VAEFYEGAKVLNDFGTAVGTGLATEGVAFLDVYEKAKAIFSYEWLFQKSVEEKAQTLWNLGAAFSNTFQAAGKAIGVLNEIGALIGHTQRPRRRQNHQ